jgi:hypothetical protein
MAVPNVDLRHEIAEALHAVFPADCYEADAADCIACQERAHAAAKVVQPQPETSSLWRILLYMIAGSQLMYLGYNLRGEAYGWVALNLLTMVTCLVAGTPRTPATRFGSARRPRRGSSRGRS